MLFKSYYAVLYLFWVIFCWPVLSASIVIFCLIILPFHDYWQIRKRKGKKSMNDAWFRYICGGMQSAQSAYFGAIYYLLNIRLKYINLKAIIVLLLCICLDFCKYMMIKSSVQSDTIVFEAAKRRLQRPCSWLLLLLHSGLKSLFQSEIGRNDLKT